VTEVDRDEETGLWVFLDFLMRVTLEFHLWPEDVVEGMIVVFVLELVEEDNLNNFPCVLMVDFFAIEVRTGVFKGNGVKNGDKIGFAERVEGGLEEALLRVEVLAQIFS
jgi:hypothetical protein